MPLTYYRSHDQMEVGIWNATERSAFFKDILNSQDFPLGGMESIKHNSKQHQWLASRFLLCHLYPSAIQLYKKNKPILYNGPFVSFSHSDKLVAVSISARETGIDIQKLDTKICRIAPRFVNAEDERSINLPGEVLSLSMIWSIKEAVFKVYGSNLPFKNIIIKEFNPVTDRALVHVIRNGMEYRHELVTLILEEATSAYVLD